MKKINKFKMWTNKIELKSILEGLQDNLKCFLLFFFFCRGLASHFLGIIYYVSMETVNSGYLFYSIYQHKGVGISTLRPEESSSREVQFTRI